MANLPPKPESPTKDERRHDPRDGVTTARPMAPAVQAPSTPHYRPERLPDSYVPRSRPETETYIPPYAPRRPQRDWERDRSGDRDWRRDSRRTDNWRDPDRRDPRAFDRRRDDDRFRRRYDSGYRRSRSPPSRRSRSPPRYRRSRSPPPRRFSPGRRSRSRTRSPHYRRGYSPRGRPRAPSRSRSPPPRSPPPKRLKLGNHSISDSPRTPRGRSKSYVRSRSRTRSRSPRRPSNHNNAPHKTPPPSSIKEKNLTPGSPILNSRPISPKRQPVAPPPLPIPTTFTHNNESLNAATPQGAELPTPTIKTEEPITINLSLREHPVQPTSNHPIKPDTREDPAKIAVTKNEPPLSQPRADPVASQSSSTPKQDVKVEPRGRSHSPPKGPRAFQWRKTSKSPPKGPRNPGSSTPSMTVATPAPPPAPAPASTPAYPTGPRADRRPKDQPEPSSPDILQSSKYTQIPPIAPERYTRIPNFAAPEMHLAKMEAEMRRMRSSRITLNKELDGLREKSRRALHEVEMATIDLRMAEGRRKIAGAQFEKAKQGTLGIDYIAPPEATPD